VFKDDNPKIDKPPSMSDSHITVINSMLKDMINNIPKDIINIIYATLHPIMKFKLKPIWLYQSQEDGEIEWVGEHVDEIVDNLPNINIQNLEFIPIILYSCSRIVQEVDDREYSWTYIQGAGDDEENWAVGLTPEIFWKYKDQILQSDDPIEVEHAVRSSIEEFYERVVENDDHQIENVVFRLEKGLTIVKQKQYLSSDLSIDDIIQSLYRTLMLYDCSIYDETNICSIPIIIIIEPNTKKKIAFETIIRYNSNILCCFVSVLVKKNGKEQNKIWCNEIIPTCISFRDEKKQDVILVSSDGCLPFVIATALMCSSSIVADNITIDKEVIKSKMALIQSFTSDIVIPRRFIKILNNFFLGEHNS
jgi:hypothetical protein